MFLAIIGTRQSGKSTLEDYLVSHHGFIALRLQSKISDSLPANDDSNRGTRSDQLSSSTDSPSTSKQTKVSTNHLPEAMADTRVYQRDSDTSFLLLNSPLVDETNTMIPPVSKKQPIHFLSPFDMLDYATRNWRVNYVTADVISWNTLQKFIIRPFFLLVSVDAPVLERFLRIGRNSGRAISLEQFLREHDQEVYGLPESGTSSRQISPLHTLDKLVNLRIINSYQSLPEFHTHLDSLNILNPDRLRPQWDTYFMHLASLASLRSNCMKRRVGAILVRNSRIVATGYNGTARGLKNCNEGGCARCNAGGLSEDATEECVCLHAEENALLEAGRDRIGNESILYCNTCPCLKCSVKIIQAGVKEVVYHLGYKVDEESSALFSEAGVNIRRHAFPT